MQKIKNRGLRSFCSSMLKYFQYLLKYNKTPRSQAGSFILGLKSQLSLEPGQLAGRWLP